MYFNSPVFVALNIFCSVCSSLVLLGKSRTWTSLRYGLFLFFTVILINMMINSRGATVILVFWRVKITLESLLYGMCTGGILISMFLWINCFGSFFNMQKLMFVFYRIMPKVAVMLSMATKTFGDIKKRISTINMVRRVDANKYNKGIIDQFKMISNLSTSLLSWTLEDSVETIYSMKSRGYGNAKRTYYKKYNFRSYDFVAIIVFLVCIILQILFSYKNAYIEYYPTINLSRINPIAYFSYAVAVLFPVIVEFWGDLRLWYSR